MFKLFRTDSGQYKVISESMGLDCEGSLPEMTDVMRGIGTPQEQIDLALDNMLVNMENCADFGVNLDTGKPSFIYSDFVTLDYVEKRIPRFTRVTEQTQKTA